MKALLLKLAVATMLFSAVTGRAVISVGGGFNSNSITFDTAPSNADWSTRFISGSAADITTAAALDAAVQTNSAASFTNALISYVGRPAVRTTAAWSSDGYVYTGPTQCAAHMLLATLRNDSGGTIANLHVGYDFLPFGGGTLTIPEVPGQRVYFSLSGQPNSWQVIPQFSGDTNWGARDVWLNLGSWPNGAVLYLLWAQDNASQNPDDCFAIDNFYATQWICDSFYWLQPFEDLTVREGQPARFSIGLCPNERFAFQWYKDGVAIPGATNWFIDFPRARSTDAGTYYTSFSRHARLTVLADTEPPRALLAYQVEETNAAFDTIVVFFSERVETNGASVTANYALSSTAASNTAPQIFAAIATNETNVVLQVGNLTPGVTYLLTVSNVTDQSASNHLLAPNPTTLLVQTFRSPIVAVDAPWKHFEAPTNTTWPGWMNATNDDSPWPTGQAGFGIPVDEILPPQFAVRTFIRSPDIGGPIATYFRTWFNLSAAETNAVMQFAGVFDDGAVVYLNGKELWRVRMPLGFVTTSTLATNAPEPHPLDGPVDLYAPGLLRAGPNLLAVELHQATPASGDAFMALALRLTRALDCPARLSISMSGSNAVSVSWTCGGVLQASPALDRSPDSWQDIVTSANSFTTNLAPGALFFRIR